jgi:hypothetical protein
LGADVSADQRATLPEIMPELGALIDKLCDRGALSFERCRSRPRWFRVELVDRKRQRTFIHGAELVALLVNLEERTRDGIQKKWPPPESEER